MRKFFTIALVALALSVAPSGAQDNSGDVPSTADQAREVLKQLNATSQPSPEDFLTGSIKFTAYHEFGHFLVDEYGIPVLARGEDMADSYATFALGPNTTKEQMEAPVRLWLYVALKRANDKIPIIWWDEHSIDQARAFLIACYLSGAWPDRFSALPGAFGASSSRAMRCERDAKQTRDDWARTLYPAQGVMAQLQKAVVSYEDAPPELAKAREWLMASNLLEDIADEVRRYKLPPWRVELADRLSQELYKANFRPRYVERAKMYVAIVGTSCGRANAFYRKPFKTAPGMLAHDPLDPQRAMIVVCYELIDKFRAFPEAAVVK